jgi:adenylate cyclase
MAAAVLIRVFDRQSLMFAEEFEGPVELGRQSEPGEQIYSRRLESGRWRLVVAGSDEPSVSRKQVLVEPSGAGVVRLTNTSGTVPVRLSGGVEIAPRSAGERALPAVLAFGSKTVEILPAEGEGDASALRRLDEATIAPSQFAGPGTQSLPALALPATDTGAVEVESLLRWLQAVVVTLQSANRSTDFFRTAARAVVEALGMDTGCVLLYQDGWWRTEAHYRASAAGTGAEPQDIRRRDWRPSRQVLRRLAEERRTLWRDPETSADGSSLDLGCSVVAAPILDRRCQVIGALYGERQPGGCAGFTGFRIKKIDAMLLELLASGLAAGLARLELEKLAVASRVRFEQFFTPELADELAARPDLLKGREVEVTLLFCDIRGFSGISERIGPARTVEWVSDVMGSLSDCVLDHHGVLVDYIGDELIAMWGAPKEAPDHARLACLSALDILDALPEIDARWQPVLGEATDVGIGINSGLAQVGNTGSSRKFKYGALGNTVNLASRVQGATRYLKTRLVVTDSTQAQLGDEFPARRLGKAAFVNIAGHVELYQLSPPAAPGWEALRSGYQDALSRFETRRFRETIQILGNLLADYPDDGPSLILLSRAVNSMVDDASAFDPVWKLPGK